MTGAIIGCGRIASQHIEGLKAAGIQIAALVNRTEAKARALASAHDLPDARVFPTIGAMLATMIPDLSSVALADPLHDKAIEALLERQIPVLCEKPLAPTADRARRLSERARLAGVPTGVRFPLRFAPAYRGARRLVQSGFLGVPHSVSGRLSVGRLANPDAPFEWRMDAGAAPLGVLGDLGSHLFDLTRFLMDLPDELSPVGTAVCGVVIPDRPTPVVPSDMRSGIPAPAETSDPGSPVAREPVMNPDLAAVAAIYRLEDRPVALSLYFSRVSSGSHLYQVDGTEGSLRVADGRLYRHRRIVTNHQRPASDFEEVSETEIGRLIGSGSDGGEGGSVHPEFAAFVAAVRESRQTAPTFADGYRVLRDLESLTISGSVTRLAS